MKNIYLYFFIFFFCSPAFSQYSSQTFPLDTLAIVDKHPITTQDLFERVSMMPYEDKLNDRDFGSIKRKAVESLVGEYLLSQVNISEDSLDWRKNYTETVLEKLFMRDALFKREIREKVQIGDLEILEGIKQLAKRKQILVVSLSDDERGNAFMNEWKRKRKKGISHSAIFSKSSFRYDSVYIALGSMDSVLESATFRIKDTLEVVGPIQSLLFGRVAISLVKEESNPAAKDISLAERRKTVKDILRDRKESQFQVAFFDKILRGQQMNADSSMFLTVAQKFRDVILRDTIARKVPDGYRYLPTDIYELMVTFKTQLDSPIVRGTFGELKLGIFLEHLYYYDFTVPSMRPRSFVVSFFQMLRAVTEGEMVAIEAQRRGLKYDPDVRRDMSVWNTYNRSRKVEYRIADTVGIEEWQAYWSLWRNNIKIVEENLQFNIQEVLLNDSATAVNCKKQIAHGSFLDSIARTATIRNEWKESGGISGWFPFKKRIELSSKLMMVPLHEISGPLKLKEGYSVVRVLGRRFTGDSVYVDSLLQRELLRMRTKKQKSVVNSFVAAAAQNHRVEIYYDKINKADVVDINFLTRRIIGFGGRINAAPFLLSQWEWVDKWKKLKNINP